jgi:hypothetical protein
MTMVENCPNFHDMTSRLLVHAKKDLLELAESECAARGMGRPNRCCRRFRDCLICFFADHFPDFPAGFRKIAFAQNTIPRTLYMTLQGTDQQLAPSTFEETDPDHTEAKAHEPLRPPVEELAQAAVKDDAPAGNDAPSEYEAPYGEANFWEEGFDCL